MISIVIPTLNEEKYLPKLLNSIKKQDCAYEVIVADSNSEDNTREIAKDFGCKIVKGGKPSEGRNNGAKAAKHPLILFLDSDVIIPNDFLKLSVHEVEKRNLGLATCKVIPLSDHYFDKLYHKSYNTYIELVQELEPTSQGYCIFSKKKVFDKIGGFNEDMTLGEDQDYIVRASEITKFRVLNSTYIYTSVRRFEKEGRLNLTRKHLLNHLYYILTRKGDLYDYDFSGYALSKEERRDIIKKVKKKIKKSVKKIQNKYKGFKTGRSS